MGKRRERRMAAKSSAGRRVKLDLFAEPSGDLGGSSAKDELEGGLDSKRSDGLPNSPSSSGGFSTGQQPENPLLLLGQYSDDEEENQSSSSHDHANGDTSLSNHIDQVEAPPPPVKNREELNVCMDAEQVQIVEKDAIQDSSSPKGLQKVDKGDSRDGDGRISDDPRKEIDAGEQHNVGGTSDAQVVGDVSSGWKMVLHEESNRYYYWNVETGETSWEVPEALAQLAEASGNGTYATAAGEKTGGLPLDARDLSSTFIAGGEVAAGFEDYATSNGHLVAESQSLGEVGTPGDGLTEGLEGTVPRDLPDSGDVCQGFEVGMHDSIIGGKHDSGIDHWSHLIKLGESLLQKLNLLRSSLHLPPDHDWIPKCVLEVEIRLSDMKLLSSYGSLLNPFWVHSEGRLRQLESFIDNSKVGQGSDSQLNGDTKETNLFGATEDSGPHRSVKDESKTGHLKSEVPSDELTHSYPGMVTLTGAAAAVPCEDVPVTNGVNVYSEEDMDMDVDMEVEDATSEGHNITVEKLGGETFAASDNSAKQEELAEPPNPSPGPGDGSPIPPPPDEEWIPPPPPDPEQIPPPPDEPEPSYPLPPPTEVGQPLPYTDPYSLSYPNSSYGIYGHSEVTGTNFYGHAEGQVMVPQVSLPYGAVFSTYSDPVSVVNNVETLAYYNIQDASGPSIGVAAVGSTQFQIQSAPLSYSSLSTDQVGAGHSSLLSLPSVETSEASGNTGDGFSGVTSTSAPTSSATTLSRESVSDPSVSTTAAATTVTASADAKVQPKALRTKKRTVATAPSLRSNKKVSSLVDKWKAAKEELEEEEEDEAKTALAMLEKKRQREIEEWRAQQIASGEAKENANFQPLGGDWRERVKRKRAQAKKEAASTTEEPPRGNQQPDSGNLSKDLPSGWQAYWDESSKQFYYGNTLTSETSWIRPTK